MEVNTWDSVFVRAPRLRLHPVIADVAGWGRWWPGIAVATGAKPRAFDVTLRPPGSLRRPQRWTVVVAKNRRDLGLEMRYEGALTGEAEFYYLDEPVGTVVHYMVRGHTADRGWRRVVRDHRAGVRAGLDMLKDRFERHRLPGDEPATALLAEQQRAMRAFAEGVAAWERKQAAPPSATEAGG